MSEADQVKAQFDAWLVLEKEKNQAERRREQANQKASLDMTRRMLTEQVKGKHKDPASKRAVGCLMDFKFDMEDFQSKYIRLVNPDKSLVDLNTNMEEVQSFLVYCSQFGNMMVRKIQKELESYEIANRSRYSWLTEKYFREEDLFDTKEGDAWYESEELTKDEKVKKLRSAERQASMAMHQKRQFAKRVDQDQRGWKRSRWGPDHSASSAAGAPHPIDGSFDPQQLYYPPPFRGSGGSSGSAGLSGLRCYSCDEYGHLRRDCPKKKH